jgi:hypothetical protein
MDDTIPAPERSQTASDEPSPRLAVPSSLSASRLPSDSETNRSDIAPKSKISPEEAEALRAKALEILRADIHNSKSARNSGLCPWRSRFWFKHSLSVSICARYPADLALQEPADHD